VELFVQAGEKVGYRAAEVKDFIFKLLKLLSSFFLISTFTFYNINKIEVTIKNSKYT
jgi:hypothetical protein